MKNLALHSTFFALIALLATGCGDFAVQGTFQTLQDIDEGKKPVIDLPSCQVDTAQYLLDVDLLSFEMKDKFGVKFGFDLLEGFFNVLGLKIRLAKGEMVASFNISQAVNPGASVAYSKGVGASKEREFAFNLDAGELGIDFDYFYRTPLHQLMEKTLGDGLNKLNDELGRQASPWTSRVLHIDEDLRIIMPSGSVAGVRVGDKFNAYNVEYVWKGTPCLSELILEKKTSADPVAVAEVIQVENHASLLQIVKMSEQEPLELGARIEILELALKKKEKSRRLARPVRIRNVESVPLELPNGQQFDLVPYTVEQLKIMFSDHAMIPSM